jgi:hypothetical protein
MPSWKHLSAALVLLFGLATVCEAQTFRGGINGRVTDSTGAVLPGVTVTVTNDATGIARTTTTSTAGDFSVPDLQLGMFGVITNTRNANNAPGIGAGEPFNVQLAVKFIF